ncbi:MAG: FG-GAP repeat domain-containing protein, partial [Armatimonadota bacterium]
MFRKWVMLLVSFGIMAVPCSGAVTINTISNNGRVSAWYNDGGVWKSVSVANVGLVGRRLVLADAVTAGKKDIYATGGDQLVRIRATSAMSLGSTMLFTGPGYAGYSIAAGDINADGNTDLVLGYDTGIKAFTYNGNWSETQIASGAAGPIVGIGIGDSNTNGTNEIASFEQSSNGTVKGYQWDGSAYANNWSHNTGISWNNGGGGNLDVNADGKVDFASVGATNGGILMENFNVPGPGIGAELIEWSFGAVRDVALADVDGDGVNDVVVLETNNLWKDDKVGGSWVRTMIATPSRQDLRALDCYDIDNDGKAEVFTVNNNGDLMQYDWTGSSWESTTLLLGTGDINTTFQDIQIGDVGLDPTVPPSGIVTINTISAGGVISAWYQDGANWKSVDLTSPGFVGRRLVIADPVGNGRKDLYAAGSMQLLRVFAAAPRSLDSQMLFSGAGYDGFSIASGDVNKDGNEDIVFGYSDGIKVFSYAGYAWTETQVASTFGPVVGLGVGDTNANGTGEIAAFLAADDGT